jgi:predicted GNAT superfamily acetyltransferase
MTPQLESVERLKGAPWRTRLGAVLVLRHCRSSEELDACVALQRETWGYDDLEVTPNKSFVLAQELGGQVIGAFDERGSLVGFAMSMAAVAPGDGNPEPYLHSHMLAVTPQYWNQGLGARLKLVQREDALARGIRRMTWTFDPLQAKNAYLNIHRLGAIARRYSPDFYGVSSSRLQSGLPTDRLHAEWWLASARVEACVSAILAGKEHALAPPEPVEQSIRLPSDLEQWKQDGEGLHRLRALQGNNRALFVEAFARGLAVVDFCRDADGCGVFQLAAWHPRVTTVEGRL